MSDERSIDTHAGTPEPDAASSGAMTVPATMSTGNEDVMRDLATPLDPTDELTLMQALSGV